MAFFARRATSRSPGGAAQRGGTHYVTTPGELFTAAQIARALGCSKQNVRQRLFAVPADTEQMNGGNLAKVWRIDSLPPTILRQLSNKAEAKRYRTVADLLREPFNRYETPIPLAEIAPGALERARKLRAAMQNVLPLRNDASVSTEQLAKQGVEAYKRAFGHEITPRHWRTLLDRTIERDNGAEEWARLEIYVEDNPPSISSRRPISMARERGLEVLESAMTTIAGLSALSCTRKSYLWTKACDELRSQIESGTNKKKAKRAIVKVLLASGLLGADKETIRRNLNRQWAAFLKNGGKLIDRRAIRDQRARLPEEDRKKLVARALDCGGRVSQAFRELRNGGELSQATLARTISNPLRKRYVPASIRREITPEINRLMPLHHGEREHELRGPYVPQNYDRIAAGQAMQLDDVTVPVLFWEQDPESPGGIFFGRGQWILAIDLRSRMILGHALHSAPVYNMRIVRSLLLRVHDVFGLPETLVLERGMWRTAKIIKGDELDICHTEQGLREFDITFRHRTRPCGKIIERVIGLLQNQMERLPGYVGRDERHDRFERVQEQIRAVNAGREHPSSHFLSKSDWLQQLDQIILRYNHERQEGKLKSSPLEAWNINLLPEGTVHLGSHARYLLAHHKTPVKVQPSGIRLRESLGGGLYYNEITGRFAGQRMLAWINPDELDEITLTSLDRREGPYIVEKAEALAPIDASESELARSQRQIAAHNDYARTQYRVIQDQLVRRSFRRLFVDRATIELGEKIEAQSSAAKVERQRNNRLVRTAQQEVRTRRLNIHVDTRNAARAMAAAQLAKEAFEDTEK
jgi:hypothetical protein